MTTGWHAQTYLGMAHALDRTSLMYCFPMHIKLFLSSFT